MPCVPTAVGRPSSEEDAWPSDLGCLIPLCFLPLSADSPSSLLTSVSFSIGAAVLLYINVEPADKLPQLRFFF